MNLFAEMETENCAALAALVAQASWLTADMSRLTQELPREPRMAAINAMKGQSGRNEAGDFMELLVDFIAAIEFG